MVVSSVTVARTENGCVDRPIAIDVFWSRNPRLRVDCHRADVRCAPVPEGEGRSPTKYSSLTRF
jgi:hypothetical protein